jgi:hypothetical protein
LIREFFVVRISAASTHPNIAALVDPLFACGEKRVEFQFLAFSSSQGLPSGTLRSSAVQPCVVTCFFSFFSCFITLYFACKREDGPAQRRPGELTLRQTMWPNYLSNLSGGWYNQAGIHYLKNTRGLQLKLPRLILLGFLNRLSYQ